MDVLVCGCQSKELKRQWCGGGELLGSKSGSFSGDDKEKEIPWSSYLG